LLNEYGIVMAHSGESEMLYRSLGVIESEEILDTITSVRLLGGECPEGEEGCDPSEKTPRPPSFIPAAQPLADTLLAAIEAGEAGSTRYCRPSNLDDAPDASPDVCSGTWRVVGYAPVNDPFRLKAGSDEAANLFVVVVDVPEEIFLQSIVQQRLQGIGIAALIAALTLIASVAVARTLARPIGKLAAAAQDVEEDQPFEPEDIADVAAQGDELGNLARVFSRMVLALRARMAELRTVYQIGQDITATLEVEETLQAILDRVRDVVSYDAAEITLLDRQENTLIVTAWSGEDRFDDTRGRTYLLGEGFVGAIGQGREGMLVHDIQEQVDREGVRGQLSDGVAVRSLLGVPLLIRDHLVGTIELVSSRVGAFGEDEQRLLETIAPQAAIAIEKAQQVREREQRLKSQIERLRIEIDEVKRARHVEEIVESDYFQRLREEARRIRDQGGGGESEAG
jgi:putative methionine-R-sulfoxide reductase with GAF domain/HAMP domain-containing protein